MKTQISNEVAKPAGWRKMPPMRFLALILALAGTASAQQPEGGRPPSPPPPPGEGGPQGPPQFRDRGRDHDGERRGPPGMMPGMGKPPMRYDGFEKLSEAEKAKVRAAFEKAWQRGEVLEARDRAMRANEEMRNTLHRALKEVDPEVVAILEKIKPPFPMDQRGLPEMPKPESPEFGRMAVARLGAEMMSVAKPERREDTRRFHDRIMQMPRIREALTHLEQMPPAERIEGFKKFRDVYRQVAGEEFVKMREQFAPSKDGGFRKPPEGGQAGPAPRQAD
ncbi:MAG: hypothetical protein ACO1TE_01255 [Prosthecobacter sp.]